MAVIVKPRKKGFFEQLIGVAAPVMGLIPGMQPVAAGLGALNAAMSGDAGGAVSQAAQVFGGQEQQQPQEGGDWQSAARAQQELNYDPQYQPSLLMRQWMGK
jgi:hypothetical protein